MAAMGMNQQLSLKQTAKMTVQMQQAIGLLQLSTLELEQKVRDMVDANPMLEMDESTNDNREVSLDSLDQDNHNNDDFDPFNDEASIHNTQIDGETSHDIEIKENGETNINEVSNSDYQDNFQNVDFSAGPRAKGPVLDNDDVYEGETTETLQDHLSEQLELSPLQGADKLIAQTIIDGVNDSGYLTESLEDILSCVVTTYPDTTIEDVQAILKLVQHYDPIGVASRNLQENLLIQLNELPKDTINLNLAIRIVKDYFELLANKDFRSLCKKLSIKEDLLKEANNLIVSLNPRPGNFKPSKKDEYIIPDVIVVKDKNGNYDAVLNSQNQLRVRISKVYKSLADKATNKKDKEFFQNNLREANWLLSSIDERNETLLNTSRYIVEHQKDFMELGESGMHPMVLNDVATEIGRAESTISRITTNKFIATPKGTFELKYFFTSKVSTDDGDSASSMAIKAKIKELIAAENQRKPLSDDKLSEMLGESGFKVARRTVAKYREALGIESSSKRKKL